MNDHIAGNRAGSSLPFERSPGLPETEADRPRNPSARPRVLVIAEAANPEMVSVPLVGWSLANALREVADIHLVTQVRNREAILRAGWVEGRDFTAIDSEAVAAPLWKLTGLLGAGTATGKNWTLAQAISVVSDAYFERLVWRRFGADIRAGRWDLVHRITPLSPVKPSLVGRKAAQCGVPFVMGPLNGGVPWPKGYEQARNKEREWLATVRGAVRLMPGRLATWRAASAILTGSRHTQGEIASAFRDKTVYLPENGIDPERFAHHAAIAGQGAGGRPLRAGFIGRLVAYKGADMLIEAATPLISAGRLVLDIIGDGPMAGELEALAQRNGVRDGIDFRGWVQHRDVAGILAGCDLLAFPSIREFGGGVVLEAMAIGLPPLVVDYAGPGELIEPQWGFKVPIAPREALIASLRAELERIVADPSILVKKGAAARARIEAKFTWARKAAQVREIYDAILGKRQMPLPFG